MTGLIHILIQAHDRILPFGKKMTSFLENEPGHEPGICIGQVLVQLRGVRRNYVTP